MPAFFGKELLLCTAPLIIAFYATVAVHIQSPTRQAPRIKQRHQNFSPLLRQSLDTDILSEFLCLRPGTTARTRPFQNLASGI